MLLHYYRISVFCFITTLCFIKTYAQEDNAYLKSLYAEINSSETDSIKINKLLALSTYYYEHNGDVDSMIVTAKKAAKLSKKNKLLAETCKSYGSIGDGYLLKNNLDSAYYYNISSYNIAKELARFDLEFSALIRLSSYFLKNNDLVNAIDYGIEAVKIAEGLDDKSLMATAYYKLAYTFAYHDDSIKHKHYLDKAYSLIDKQNIEVSIIVKSGVYASMVDYFEQKRFKNPKEKALQDSVVYYAEKGIVYGRYINKSSLLAYLLGAKGKMYFIKDQVKEAKKYYNEALTYKDKIDNTNLLNLYNKLAYVYLKEKNTKQALSYKDSILKDINKEPNYYKKGERYNLAYYISKTAKKYDLALEYHENMMKMFNKAKDEEQINSLNELEIKYEGQKKDAQIASQKLENETLKRKAITNYSIFGIIALLCIGILGYLYLRKKNKVLSTELNLAHTKASLHRSQINPHFISNSINAIYPFLYDKSDPNKAAAYLSDLSKMIRNILDSTFETNWTVKEEIEFIEQYCNIQRLKMDVPLQLDVSYDSSLNTVTIPSLITQTFIENCFVHGFNNKNELAIIKLNILKLDSDLQIVIIDNGEVSEKINNGHQSRSTKIVEQRIVNTYSTQKLSKDFLTYGVKNNSYQVIIKLPLST